MTVDTDKLVEILEKNQPLNVTLVEDNNKPKLVVMFALPHLLDKIEVFSKTLIDATTPNTDKEGEG